MADNWRFWACGEFCGTFPDGQVRPVDQGQHPHWRVEAGGPEAKEIALATPSNGWLSLRLVVEGQGEYSVSAQTRDDEIAIDLYREFYHKLAKADEWHGDALVPVKSGRKLALPDADNNVPGQKIQGFWVDVWVPAGAKVGPHRAKLVLKAGGAKQTIDLAVEVLPLAYPDENAVHMDYNSYGSDFLLNQYPKSLPHKAGPAQDAAVVRRIHQYHAMIFEHRGLYHQLGFGHSGATTPLFAPAVAGDGRNRHVSDWSLYDAHYGPLCDGSAFAGGHRRPEPIYAIYLPFTPNWPADYLGWGQKGYRVELVNVLRDFDAHFREKGWTKTILEFFFNHKKRHRYFEWDGDEPRYKRDDIRVREYREFLDEATKGSPVQWRFRSDASWMMNEHWTSMVGLIDFWVNGGFVDFWEHEVHAGPMARGDITWTYRGAPPIQHATADILQQVYRTWFSDFTGNTLWLTTGVGADPWFASDGCATGLIYPGERFGIDGPVPSIRMKVMRNAVQDVNLLQRSAGAGGKDRIKSDIMPKVPLKLWTPTPEGMKTAPPEEWTAAHYHVPFEPDQARYGRLDPLWWQDIRDYARKGVQEVARG